MRLLVNFPVIGGYTTRGRILYTAAPALIETQVRVVRRHPVDHRLRDHSVIVEAFCPDHFRRGIEAPKSQWADQEYLRTTADIALNKKSLAAFLDSGESELHLSET